LGPDTQPSACPELDQELKAITLEDTSGWASNDHRGEIRKGGVQVLGPEHLERRLLSHLAQPRPPADPLGPHVEASMESTQRRDAW
jgi:hypothetical protein